MYDYYGPLDWSPDGSRIAFCDVGRGRLGMVNPDGTPIDGVQQMKDYILGPARDAFLGSLVEHLFAYALGRDIHFADRAELEQIVEHVRREARAGHAREGRNHDQCVSVATRREHGIRPWTCS